MDLQNNKVPRIWDNETVYIVGGGPSLTGFDWEKLKNKKTIGINRAFLSVPEITVLYWMDRQIYTWYKKEIDAYKGLKITTSIPENAASDIYVIKSLSYAGLYQNPEYICKGCNSGAGAIDLAFKLGASRIILLGYDMQPGSSGQSHWHEGYGQFGYVSGTKVYDRMLFDFVEIQHHIKEKSLELEIINACPESRITVFPKVAPDSIF